MAREDQQMHLFPDSHLPDSGVCPDTAAPKPVALHALFLTRRRAVSNIAYDGAVIKLPYIVRKSNK